MGVEENKENEHRAYVGDTRLQRELTHRFMKVTIRPNIRRRAVANIIDYGIFLVFFSIIAKTFGHPNNEGGYTLTGVALLWIPFFWTLYFPIVESIKGRSLGKMILGLTVVDKRGGAISVIQAFQRRFLDFIDFSMFGLVAYIVVKNTPNNQRLGDLWAETIVVGEDESDCPYCKEKLRLSVEEVMKREFTCPVCGTMTKVASSMRS